jgi:type VI secretion system protein ImpM
VLTAISSRFEVGFYGKLPSHGDFLRRRVSDAFVGVWDAWLQECVASSRDALGARWLDVYLTSPAWRFVCAAGACGPAPVAGVMVPSVDRVGRYFPLALVAELPATANPIAVPGLVDSFFAGAEQLAVEALSADRLDFEAFDNRVGQLADELAAIGRAPQVVLDPAAEAILASKGAARWQLPIGSAAHVGLAFQHVLAQRLTRLYQPLVLWWTEGSSMVGPSCLVDRGLPHPDTFAALLDGCWNDRGWGAIPMQLEIAPGAEVLIDEATPPRFRSAGISNVGRVREINQDALLERPEVGIWAVADGVGGHSHGEVASRMVCDAVADVIPGAGFADVIASVRLGLDRVNQYLVRQAERSPESRSGSTVVVLLTRGSRCAVLWAGDSRVYRFRDGRLTQLTRDHSVAESGAEADRDSTAITRAVGGDATLDLDELQDRVHAGDRFLLCTDGLTREVPEAQIRGWMEHQDVRAAVDGLIKAALDAGGRDNVTALIVEARA